MVLLQFMLLIHRLKFTAFLCQDKYQWAEITNEGEICSLQRLIIVLTDSNEDPPQSAKKKKKDRNHVVDVIQGYQVLGL